MRTPIARSAVFAFSGEALVGGGRTISDDEAPATVCELVVAPEYQRKGVGRAILRSILRKLAVPRVILACVHGQQDFYRREGFLSHKSVMALYANTQWFVENANLESGDPVNVPRRPIRIESSSFWTFRYAAKSVTIEQGAIQ